MWDSNFKLHLPWTVYVLLLLIGEHRIGSRIVGLIRKDQILRILLQKIWPAWSQFRRYVFDLFSKLESKYEKSYKFSLFCCRFVENTYWKVAAFNSYCMMPLFVFVFFCFGLSKPSVFTFGAVFGNYEKKWKRREHHNFPLLLFVFEFFLEGKLVKIRFLSHL